MYGLRTAKPLEEAQRLTNLLLSMSLALLFFFFLPLHSRVCNHVKAYCNVILDSRLFM